MMGIQYAVYMGVGNFLANMVGGIVYEVYGGKVLFRYSSFLYALWCILLVIELLIRNKRNKKQSHGTREEMKRLNVLS